MRYSENEFDNLENLLADITRLREAHKLLVELWYREGQLCFDYVKLPESSKLRHRLEKFFEDED